MASFPTLPQPGAQMGTVPGGGTASMNLNPLGQSPMTSAAAASPVASTLPGGVQPMYGIVPGGTSATNTTTAAAGGFVPSSGNTNPNTATQEAGAKTMLGDFQATYGQGTGTALANALGNLGTTTSVAANQMIGPAMQAAQQGWQNIEQGMGARGVSADSSTAGLAAGDYWGQVNQGISSELGQIGLNEEQTLLQALQGEGAAHGSDVSGWDTFGNVMSGLGGIAGQVLGAAIPGGGTIGGSLFNKMMGGGAGKAAGANTSSILDAIGGAGSMFMGA